MAWASPEITDQALGLVPINTWDRIIDRIIAIRKESNHEKKIDSMIAILINIRLLDKEDKIQDKRDFKGNIEEIYKKILEEIRCSINATESPTDEFIYFAREFLKKMPIRSGSRDLIGDIRSAAEFFEEGRNGYDPVLSFAGDLRKEVHRKLSPKILTKFIAPYLELVRHNNRQPMREAGYFALAGSFDPSKENKDFIVLAEELADKLAYLWDYEKGDIAVAKENLAKNMEIFDRCFLKKEIQTFLEFSSADRISDSLILVDCLKRLASFKIHLKKSYFEKRIDFLDFLILDLDLGRLIFIFANDLTNNHFEEISFSNLKDCIALVRELSSVLNLKGLTPGKNVGFSKDLSTLSSAETIDILKVKRTLQNASIDMQYFMQTNVVHRLSQMLNNVLEAYEVPTSNLAPIKGRFFNNFIRTTLFHAVSEFIEKIIIFLDREIAVRNAESSLYGTCRSGEIIDIPDTCRDGLIATTWTETPTTLRPYLGGKGNGIIEMSALGINVPPAFILASPICKNVLSNNPDKVWLRKEVRKYLHQLEERTGKLLGNPMRPLLVSVRSGAMISLPGSMCTILNTGITQTVFDRLAIDVGPEFASNVYLRFLKNVLTALEKDPNEILGASDTSEPGQAIQIIQDILREKLGNAFLEDSFEQLLICIELVFASSRSKSVREYLEEMSIELTAGTAVTVQQMVFGNKNENCLSGVIFTRNPINGNDELFGEFKEMSQGEDIVMENIITRPISHVPVAIRDELIKYKTILENELKHELDIEFTVEDGRLFLLQNRRASISAYAKLIVDKDMMKQGIITLDEFVARAERMCARNAFMSVPRVDEEYTEWKPPLCEGIPINHGITVGTLVLTPEKLEEMRISRESVVYFAQNTKPSDFHLINNSHGIVTVFPGRTSHAAITSITLNKPCIVGCLNAVINLEQKTVTFKGTTDITLKEGELVTLDANSGNLYRGTVPVSNSFIKTNDVLEAVKPLRSSKRAAEEVERFFREQFGALKIESGFNKRNISQIEPEHFANKKILVRLDLNVPVSGNVIADTTRIEAAFPTIDLLLHAGATPILCSHLGEPDKQEKRGKSREEIYTQYSLRVMANFLRTRYPDLVFHEKSIGSSGVLIRRQDIVCGKVNLIENLRFAVGEKENDQVFSRGLAGLSDGIYVNDAFGTCHRRHASITGVTRFVDMKLGGLLVQKELRYLGQALSEPVRPFVGITGGSKISTKLGIIEALLQKIDKLIVGGGIGYTLLKATGFDVQKSLIEESMLETARKLMDRYSHKIVLPIDFVTTDNFDFANQCVGQLERDVTSIRPGWESFDLGQASIANAVSILATAGTVLWNGPIGAFEIAEGSHGTTRLAHELARLSEQGTIVIIGGGDSAAAVKTAGVAERMTHVSTGGGASLEFIERLALPGISVLDADLS